MQWASRREPNCNPNPASENQSGTSKSAATYPPGAESGTLGWVSTLCSESPTKEVLGHLNFKNYKYYKEKSCTDDPKVSHGRELTPATPDLYP